MAAARLSRTRTRTSAIACAAGVSAVLCAAPALAAPPPTTTATPTITAGPAAGSWVASTSATFRWTDKTAKATFSCKLDSGTPVACTSPKTYTGLAQGKHTFSVTAKAGTSTSSAATRTWGVDTVAPKATFAAPSTLTGAVVVAFGEPVRKAKGATTLATLTLAGGAAVPTTLTCWRGSTSVACATALFDTLRLKPTAHLVAGQHYAAHVAAAVVDDRAGNPDVASNRGFRGARNVQENAPGVTTSWQKVSTSAAAGGSFVREHWAGAAAAWSFTGSSVTWWTVTGPGYGKADVYIDGVRNRTVNNYAASRHFNVARTIGGLADKAHRLRIVVLGTKGNNAGTGTFVAIDAFTVGSTKTDTPNLTTLWRTIASSKLSAGHAVVSDLAHAVLQMTFRGTGIAWFTVTGPNQGRAAVYIDGVRKATVDNYSASASYGVKRSISGLSDALHTIKIIVVGTHHKGGTGNRVTVDRLLVA